jgi:hypothetical protein
MIPNFLPLFSRPPHVVVVVIVVVYVTCKLADLVVCHEKVRLVYVPRRQAA